MRAAIRLAAMAATIAAAAFARAEPLRVMGFGGSSNWALFAAQEQGYFRREGVEVELLSAPGSAEQMRRLMDGRIDIALTALDNVVAYREGQAAAPGDADRDIVAVFGVNRGGRSTLVAAPRIAAIAQLEGEPVGVDALATGYAFVLEEMLA
ncbi:MAG TPA: ABC transporter substrate-binding protein, partial [Usitatibacter sp.]|nr:ABC transporter substrate-binding protein [Usitatibacter sp.]